MYVKTEILELLPITKVVKYESHTSLNNPDITDVAQTAFISKHGNLRI